MEVFSMKKLLLLGALLSTVAMAQVVEVRIGGDLSNSGKFKGGFSDGADLEKKAIKKGIELSGEYRTPVAEGLEIGGGIAYKHNKVDGRGYYEHKGVDSVPVYLTARYNFKNASEVTPYIKANLGYAFNSGSLKWHESAFDYGEAKFKGGLYSGIGTGIQYKNFVVDLSYNWNRIRVDRKGYVAPYRYEDKFTISHGTLTLGVGYSFGF